MITHKTPKSEIKIEMEALADSVKEYATDARKADLCRIVLSKGTTPLLKEFIMLISHTTEEIVADRSMLFRLLNARYFLYALSTLFCRLDMVDDRTLLDSPYLSPSAQAKYPCYICADVSTFYFWLLLHGGDPCDIRRELDTKSVERMSKIERAKGCLAFPTLIIRAEIAFDTYCRHILLPACGAHVGQVKAPKMNTMANALAGVRR